MRVHVPRPILDAANCIRLASEASEGGASPIGLDLGSDGQERRGSAADRLREVPVPAENPRGGAQRDKSDSRFHGQ